MSRFIVLEIREEDNEGLHDLADLVETMRTGGAPRGRAFLRAAGMVLEVKIPTRWEAEKLGTTKHVADNLDVYMAQGA